MWMNYLMNKENKKVIVSILAFAGIFSLGWAILTTILYPSWWESLWALHLSLGLFGVTCLIVAIAVQKKY